MLHLSLAGNLLSALGGSVELYDPRIVPQYPGRMLYAKIPLILEALKTESLGRFMEVRALGFSFNLTSSLSQLAPDRVRSRRRCTISHERS